MDTVEHLSSIYANTNGIPISMHMAEKILHKGRRKIKSLVGSKINLVEGVESNSYPLNLADVLRLVGHNI